MKKLSRKEAKAQGSYLYFTGNPCKYGHVAERYTNNAMCSVCAKKYSAEQEESSESKKARYEANRDDYLANKKRYYQENRESIRAKQAKYISENKDKIAEMNRNWRKKNPDKARAIYVRNRYNRYQAIPAWLTDEDKRRINEIYKECRLMTERTGIQHHVDHIIPIRGKNISGLHVPENLQILTASENCSKKNSFDAGTLTIADAE